MAATTVAASQSGWAARSSAATPAAVVPIAWTYLLVAEGEASVAASVVAWGAIDCGGLTGAAGSAHPPADRGVRADRKAAVGRSEGIEWSPIVAVVGKGDGTWDAGDSGGGVLGAGRVGGCDDGEDIAGLGGNLDVLRR
jgi:hypothetical protein